MHMDGSSTHRDGIIRFIAVARVSDRTVLATHGPENPMLSKAENILESDKSMNLRPSL